jgi:acyl carrier protein
MTVKATETRDAVAAGTTQDTISAIWEDVLQQKGIGLQDDFFDLGGTSLDLIRVFGQVNERFGLSLDGSVLDDEATIQRLADAVDTASRKS